MAFRHKSWMFGAEGDSQMPDKYISIAYVFCTLKPFVELVIVQPKYLQACGMANTVELSAHQQDVNKGPVSRVRADVGQDCTEDLTRQLKDRTGVWR